MEVVMNIVEFLFGTQNITKILKVCDNQEQAFMSYRDIQRKSDLSKAQIELLSPLDSYKGNISSNGLFDSVLHAYLFFGTLGGILGLTFYCFLVNHFVHSPMQSLVSIVGLSITSVMLIIGFVKTDKQAVIVQIQKHLSQGKWVIIMHSINAQQVPIEPFNSPTIKPF